MSRQNPVMESYELLYAHYGSQGWWPAETRTEMMVGAILTQNTNWQNVEKALANLKALIPLDLEHLGAITVEKLAEAIRPSGYYNLKAKRLKNLVTMLEQKFAGELDLFFRASPERARADLLGVKGVGPETADSILLYGGHWPIFVVDAYTHRVFSRHNLVEEESDYHSIQDVFHTSLEEDAQLYNEFHALIVQVAKDFCHKSSPRCSGCPLNGLNW